MHAHQHGRPCVCTAGGRLACVYVCILYVRALRVCVRCAYTDVFVYVVLALCVCAVCMYLCEALAVCVYICVMCAHTQMDGGRGGWKLTSLLNNSAHDQAKNSH